MDYMPKHITVHRRLRPLRLAFLVKPNDNNAITQVFEINTCLWGGQYNAIVPTFLRTPSWWADGIMPPPSAASIIHGYLNAFDPDYIVMMDPTIAKPDHIEDDRVISPIDILNPNRHENIRYGVSACDIYQDLYKHTYRFKQRYPRKVCIPTTSEGSYNLFSAAVFGRFPPNKKLNYFTSFYRDRLDADEMPINSDTVNQYLHNNLRTPLEIGSSNLDVTRNGWRRDPILFIMDASRPRDLIDYWNLRALGLRVMPVPIQWHDELQDVCQKIIRSSYVPNRWNPQIKHRTEIMGSRSLARDNIINIIKKLELPDKKSVILSNYPRIWDEWARDKDGAIRCSISASADDNQILIEDERISFRLLAPQFEVNDVTMTTPIWTNVIQLKDYSCSSKIATIIPQGMSNLDHFLGTMHHRSGTRVSSEGIVSLSNSQVKTVYWRMRDGISVFQSWLKDRGIDAELSDKGRICIQLIHQLGGGLGGGL